MILSRVVQGSSRTAAVGSAVMALSAVLGLSGTAIAGHSSTNVAVGFSSGGVGVGFGYSSGGYGRGYGYGGRGYGCAPVYGRGYGWGCSPGYAYRGCGSGYGYGWGLGLSYYGGYCGPSYGVSYASPVYCSPTYNYALCAPSPYVVAATYQPSPVVVTTPYRAWQASTVVVQQPAPVVVQQPAPQVVVQQPPPQVVYQTPPAAPQPAPYVAGAPDTSPAPLSMAKGATMVDGGTILPDRPQTPAGVSPSRPSGLEQGWMALGEGRSLAAQSFFTDQLDKSTDKAAAFLGYAIASELVNRDDAAAWGLRQALQLDPAVAARVPADSTVINKMREAQAKAAATAKSSPTADHTYVANTLAKMLGQ